MINQISPDEKGKSNEVAEILLKTHQQLSTQVE